MVVANSTSPRDGKFIEKLGIHNPSLAKDNESRTVVNKERVEYWLSVGATPSDRVAMMLIGLGVKGAEKYKPKFTPKKKGDGAKKKAQEAAAKAAEAAAKAAEPKEEVAAA